MFKFIKKENIETQITNAYILSLEKDLGINFPHILKNFYLHHNGAELKKCVIISNEKASYSIELHNVNILTLKYNNNNNFEKNMKYIKENESIPNSFIPFAEDDTQWIICWDCKGGKVYATRHDEEYPILICESVENFFEILNVCAENNGKYILDTNEKTDFNKPIGTINKNEEINIDIEKILKYNNKNFIPSLLFLALTIFSLMLAPFTDSLTLIITAALLIYTVVLFSICIIYKIKSKNTVKEYDFEKLKKELLSKDIIKVNGIDTYLTNNYIISNHRRVIVKKYSDIAWVVPTILRGRGSLIGILGSELTNQLIGSPLRAYLKNGKTEIIAITKNGAQTKVVFDKIHEKNKSTLLGYSKYNLEQYKKECPQYQKRIIVQYSLIALTLTILYFIAIII